MPPGTPSESHAHFSASAPSRPRGDHRRRPHRDLAHPHRGSGGRARQGHHQRGVRLRLRQPRAGVLEPFRRALQRRRHGSRPLGLVAAVPQGRLEQGWHRQCPDTHRLDRAGWVLPHLAARQRRRHHADRGRRSDLDVGHAERHGRHTVARIDHGEARPAGRRGGRGIRSRRPRRLRIERHVRDEGCARARLEGRPAAHELRRHQRQLGRLHPRGTDTARLEDNADPATHDLAVAEPQREPDPERHADRSGHHSHPDRPDSGHRRRKPPQGQERHDDGCRHGGLRDGRLRRLLPADRGHGWHDRLRDAHGIRRDLRLRTRRGQEGQDRRHRAGHGHGR